MDGRWEYSGYWCWPTPEEPSDCRNFLSSSMSFSISWKPKPWNCMKKPLKSIKIHLRNQTNTYMQSTKPCIIISANILTQCHLKALHPIPKPISKSIRMPQPQHGSARRVLFFRQMCPLPRPRSAVEPTERQRVLWKASLPPCLLRCFQKDMERGRCRSTSQGNRSSKEIRIIFTYAQFFETKPPWH